MENTTSTDISYQALEVYIGKLENLLEDDIISDKIDTINELLRFNQGDFFESLKNINESVAGIYNALCSLITQTIDSLECIEQIMKNADNPEGL